MNTEKSKVILEENKIKQGWGHIATPLVHITSSLQTNSFIQNQKKGVHKKC
jgi:hypothetical protein